jgi:hypothetical protein
MLTRPACAQCRTMKRMLGDRVETADAFQHPELLALTDLETLPSYLVFDGERCVGSFAGMMPVTVWERKVATYEGGTISDAS